MLTLRYFARLRETLGCASEKLAYQQGKTDCVSSVIGHLVAERGAGWQVLQDCNTRVAVNHAVVEGDCALQDGDELAFFPPVTGG